MADACSKRTTKTESDRGRRWTFSLWTVLLLLSITAIFSAQWYINHSPYMTNMPPVASATSALTSVVTSSILSTSVVIEPVLSLFDFGKVKQILMYNPSSPMTYRSSHTNFQHCNYSNCLVHFDRSKIMKAAAVVFNLAKAPLNDTPPVPAELRNPDQAWVFFTLEAPVSIAAPKWHRDAFNWSWSYHTYSDIFNPYGYLQINTNRTNSLKNYTDIYRKKTKFAAWLVGHCKTLSRREEYIKMLQKYVTVDIYGSCAKKKVKDYEKLLNTDYKFYLGFENNFCDEYITEKFFMYYSLDLIVVVRGGGKYASLLPNGTYVNAADFQSVEELGKFLLWLGSNEEEYTAYLKRKDKFSVVHRVTSFMNAMCQLCEKLNRLESNRKAYSSVVDWINREQCYAPTDLREKRR